MDSEYTWWRFAEERHQEILRAADGARLEAMLSKRPGIRRNGALQRWSFWLGERLVTWGARLQRRYGEMPVAAAIQSPPRSRGPQLP